MTLCLWLLRFYKHLQRKQKPDQERRLLVDESKFSFALCVGLIGGICKGPQKSIQRQSGKLSLVQINTSLTCVLQNGFALNCFSSAAALGPKLISLMQKKTNAPRRQKLSTLAQGFSALTDWLSFGVRELSCCDKGHRSLICLSREIDLPLHSANIITLSLESINRRTH